MVVLSLPSPFGFSWAETGRTPLKYEQSYPSVINIRTPNENSPFLTGYCSSLTLVLRLRNS